MQVKLSGPFFSQSAPTKRNNGIAPLVGSFNLLIFENSHRYLLPVLTSLNMIFFNISTFSSFVLGTSSFLFFYILFNGRK